MGSKSRIQFVVQVQFRSFTPDLLILYRKKRISVAKLSFVLPPCQKIIELVLTRCNSILTEAIEKNQLKKLELKKVVLRVRSDFPTIFKRKNVCRF